MGWAVKEIELPNHEKTYDVVDVDGALIAPDVTLEQGRLIAAAPELLEALKAVMSGDLRAAESVLAAISKAEGKDAQ